MRLVTTNRALVGKHSPERCKDVPSPQGIRSAPHSLTHRTINGPLVPLAPAWASHLLPSVLPAQLGPLVRTLIPAFASGHCCLQLVFFKVSFSGL